MHDEVILLIEWRFQDDSCWLQLQGRQGFENAAHVHYSAGSFFVCVPVSV